MKGDGMTARYELHGTVAVITLDNPPVNGLGYATRLAIAAGLQAADEDPGRNHVIEVRVELPSPRRGTLR